MSAEELAAERRRLQERVRLARAEVDARQAAVSEAHKALMVAMEAAQEADKAVMAAFEAEFAARGGQLLAAETERFLADGHA